MGESLSRPWLIGTVLVCLALGAEVTRLTTAIYFAEHNLRVAAYLAPNSPDTMLARSMAEVGQAAARKGDPPTSTLRRLELVAAAAPLQPEPFLVQAALAERSGDYSRAETLLRQARWLNPRSTAARYLLADVWLREGKIVPGLHEMAVLTRFFPTASVQLIPALAEYAHTPGAREQLVVIVNSNPDLKRPLLSALAANPGNADLILTLAGSDIDSVDPGAQPWKKRLLEGLVTRAKYASAHALWQRFAGISGTHTPLLFNRDFSSSAAPPPFNWSFSSGTAGIAEPGNGKLRVLYYGRDDAVLASQVLLLPPGNYVFESAANGTAGSSTLTWNLSCLHPAQQLMAVDVNSGKNTGSFAVPADCEAQFLSLRGHAEENPHDTDVQLGPVRLDRVGA